MSCNCHNKEKMPEQRKGIVKLCDICDPCNEATSNVRLCAFVVPTLEEGRYFKNSFVFTQDEDATYYISDDRSEIPFGARPKFIDNFDPSEADFKNTVVYDLANSIAYVYNDKGERATIALSSEAISTIIAGDGISVEADGARYTISVDDTIARSSDLDNITVLVTNHTAQILDLQDRTTALETEIAEVSDEAQHAHDQADTANQIAVEARQDALAAQQSIAEVASDLSGKQDILTPGNNVSIVGNTISATDTTYGAFVGTDGTAAGSAGLVPAPTAADANKVLQSDGTWGEGMDSTNYYTKTEVDGLIDDVNDSIDDEEAARTAADANLQDQIDAISAGSDVKDIVSSYAALQQYDTTTLTNGDIIKVLHDETHDGATYYYRWQSATSSFTPIGSEGPYYTKGEADALLATKQDTLSAGTGINLSNNVVSADTTVLATQTDLAGKQDTLTAGTNITITSDGTISAAGTTYSDFTGADGTNAGAAGLVPAPAATDNTKYLKGDGTWATITIPQSGIPTNATFWGASYDSVNNKVEGDMSYVGPGNTTIGLISGIGSSYPTFGPRGAIFGNPSGSKIDIQESNGIGRIKIWSESSSLLAKVSSFDFYNQTKITNVKDPTAAQDAATKNYVDTAVAGAGGATISSADWSALWQ